MNEIKIKFPFVIWRQVRDRGGNAELNACTDMWKTSLLYLIEVKCSALSLSDTRSCHFTAKFFFELIPTVY